MARVDLKGINKRYPGVTALDNINLTIEPGEFFTLLGPSGCGKTTLLRAIAGFNPADSGEILFDGKRIDNVPAYERNIGMVFQDYAIFPHKSVADNVGFGLSMRNCPRAEIDARVARALALVQMDKLAARMPHELSGGQQQRVALARAMVINPQILLMDEPLSNLDAKLRLELRDDIRDLQRSLGITTIYVTHDQEEALVISDRICVMQGGRVHQVASPLEVYGKPATLFVGTFVGTMNVLADVEVANDGTIALGKSKHALPALAGRERVTLGVRPEHVMIVGLAADGPVSANVPRNADGTDTTLGPRLRGDDGGGGDGTNTTLGPRLRGDDGGGGGGGEASAEALTLDATVEKVTYAGREAFYRLDAAGLRLLVHVYRPDPEHLPHPGETLHLAFPLSHLHAFDSADGTRIALRP